MSSLGPEYEDALERFERFKLDAKQYLNDLLLEEYGKPVPYDKEDENLVYCTSYPYLMDVYDVKEYHKALLQIQGFLLRFVTQRIKAVLYWEDPGLSVCKVDVAVDQRSYNREISFRVYFTKAEAEAEASETS